MFTSVLLTVMMAGSSGARNLVSNPFFEGDAHGTGPAGYELAGNARWAWCGYADEVAARGVALKAYANGGEAHGSVSLAVNGIDTRRGRWLKFSFRGRAEDGFSVAHDGLAMTIAFYAKHGANYMDTARRLIYREILRDRKDLATNGDDRKNGAAVWRTYEFEELLPFPEVDAVKIGVDFEHGNAISEKLSSFYIEDFCLTQSEGSSDGRTEPTEKAKPAAPVSADGMLALGGRWFYRRADGEAIATDASGHLAGNLTITEANAERLFYRDDRMENPFASNLTAWLRKGDLDLNGQLVTADRLIPDNVTVTFTPSGYMAVRVRNIPNHPTAKFPDTYGTQGYNPSYIQEQNDTYYLPIAPSVNPNAQPMTERDSNMALNMGPIGFAVNGVAFYNPFDANMTDASNIMDRCCGHPSPDNRYHYHKYPICVNTPFADKGEGHSPIIGFALDGLPIYGPYESAAVMAKDLAANPLNAFNAHYDAVRGWHYHVTPGKYPYVIGGYLGNIMRSGLNTSQGR
jgi:hypothetical protein